MVFFILLAGLFLFSSQTEASSDSQLIIINKKTNELAFYESGKLLKTFKVGTGRNLSLTPEGSFRIVNKIKNRPYYTDNIPGGDPRNPLGDRWLGLDARGTYGTTYAIHGNNSPSTIGKYVSAGCVRMYNDELRWLFDRVNLYTTVIITNSENSFYTIASTHGYTVEKTGWAKENGDWYYYEKEVKKTGWIYTNNKWYYLDETGKMIRGWLSEGNVWYYLHSSGEMKTGWVKSGKSWYYLARNGEMRTGWIKDASSWYYLDETGAMKTGWHLDGEVWYYLHSSGKMKTGWMLQNANWYYFHPSGGMNTGWLRHGGNWFYHEMSGEMEIGWHQENEKWYYLLQNGEMAADMYIGAHYMGKDGVWVQEEQEEVE